MEEVDWSLFSAYGNGREETDTDANDIFDDTGGGAVRPGPNRGAMPTDGSMDGSAWLARDVHDAAGKRRALGPSGLPMQTEKLQIPDSAYGIAPPYFDALAATTERGKWPKNMAGVGSSTSAAAMDGGDGVTCVPKYGADGSVTTTCMAKGGHPDGAARCAGDCDPSSFPRIGEVLRSNTPVTLVSLAPGPGCPAQGGGDYGRSGWLSVDSTGGQGNLATQCAIALDAPLLLRFVTGSEASPTKVTSGDRAVLLTTTGKQLAVIPHAQPGLPAVQLMDKSPSAFRVIGATSGTAVRVGDTVQLRIPTTTESAPLFLATGANGMLSVSSDNGLQTQWRIVGLPTFLSTVQLLRSYQAGQTSLATPTKVDATEDDDSQGRMSATTKKTVAIVAASLAVLALGVGTGIYHRRKHRQQMSEGMWPFNRASAALGAVPAAPLGASEPNAPSAPLRPSETSGVSKAPAPVPSAYDLFSDMPVPVLPAAKPFQ